MFIKKGLSTGELTEGIIAFLLFVCTLPLANWFMGNVGYMVPGAPNQVPVWPGIAAPSGVLVIGLAFCLRDIVHRRLGSLFSLLAIIAGAIIAYVLELPFLMASVTAFLIAELADLGIYSYVIKKYELLVAVIASGLAGIFIDTFIFLPLAFADSVEFGWEDFILGQLIGKGWMLALGGILVGFYRHWEFRQGYDTDGDCSLRQRR